MSNFVRDWLSTLSFEPEAGTRTPAEREDLSRLDQRLSSLGGAGARVAIQIQPGDCSVWDGNPRDQPGLNPESCRSLIESIATEGGNRIPVLVRPNPPGSMKPYELLVGSRRRFAIDWLNRNGRPELRLSALVVNLADEEAFRLADIENREREDISELDRARSYQAAIDRFYGGVQSRMAEALNLSNSQLSRLLALAQMPEAVIGAFATKEDVKVRHSEVLTPLLRRSEERERMIAAATVIGAEQQRLAAASDRMLGPATVVARLREAALAESGDQADALALLAAGERVGRIKQNKAGGLQVEFALAPETDLEAVLAELKAKLIAVRERIERERRLDGDPA